MEDLPGKLNFLRSYGASTRKHSGGSLIAHLLGTRTLLETWGARPALCDAGLFHSVYGTESYEGGIVALELRPAVRDVIGEEAERLAFLFGIKKSATFYPMVRGVAALESGEAAHTGQGAGEATSTSLRMENRLTGEWLIISRQQLDDLITLTIANALEQAYRAHLDLDGRESEFLLSLSRFALPGAARAVLHACRQRGSTERDCQAACPPTDTRRDTM